MTNKYPYVDKNTQCQNNMGDWVPAIPLPYYLSFGRVRCDCGEKFWGSKNYRGHFALTHVMGLD